MSYLKLEHARATLYRKKKQIVDSQIKDIMEQSTITSVPTHPYSRPESPTLRSTNFCSPLVNIPTTSGTQHSNGNAENSQSTFQPLVNNEIVIEPNGNDAFNADDCTINCNLSSLLPDVDNDLESVSLSGESRPTSPEVDTREFLRVWALDNNITHDAFRSLLKGLHNIDPSLPLDPRTIFNNKKSHEVETMGKGEYVYFGLKSVLEEIFLINSLSQTNLSLSFNIDGIPLFKSSLTEFWPLLCSIDELPNLKPFPVMVFCGIGKPPIHSFFKDFLLELSDLVQNGFSVHNKTVHIHIRAFILDMPAKAHVRCNKLYSGYYGCDRCITRGEYFHRRMTYPQLDAELRTDESFLLQSDPQFHNGTSPLIELNYGLVSGFPIDYMHLVCLGVTKRLLSFWLKGMKGVRLQNSRLCFASQAAISLLLNKARKVWPSEFSRSPRGLTDFERFKATEFRQFLIYLGPVVLKGFHNKQIYGHFLMFHCAITILLSDSYAHLYNLAEELLHNFVSLSSKFYGQEFVVFNVHSLIHLTSDVRRLGSLDTFSAFQFENELGKMKKYVRSKHKPLQQLCGRLGEIASLRKPIPCNVRSGEPIPAEPHENGQTAGITGSQYKKITLSNFVLSTHPRNNTAILQDGSVVKVVNIVVDTIGNLFIVYKRFTKYSNFYDYPCESSLLSIYFVENLSDELKIATCNQIKRKAVLLQYKRGYVSFPMVHSQIT